MLNNISHTYTYQTHICIYGWKVAHRKWKRRIHAQCRHFLQFFLSVLSPSHDISLVSLLQETRSQNLDEEFLFLSKIDIPIKRVFLVLQYFFCFIKTFRMAEARTKGQWKVPRISSFFPRIDLSRILFPRPEKWHWTRGVYVHWKRRIISQYPAASDTDVVAPSLPVGLLI